LFAKVHRRHPSIGRSVASQDGIIVLFDVPTFNLAKVCRCPLFAPEGPMLDIHGHNSQEQRHEEYLVKDIQRLPDHFRSTFAGVRLCVACPSMTVSFRETGMWQIWQSFPRFCGVSTGNGVVEPSATNITGCMKSETLKEASHVRIYCIVKIFSCLKSSIFRVFHFLDYHLILRNIHPGTLTHLHDISIDEVNFCCLAVYDIRQHTTCI